MSDVESARSDLAFLRGLVDEDARPRRRSRVRGGWSPSGSSAQGRAGASALGGAFLAHFVIMVAFVIAARRLGEPRLVELLPATLFALQGVAWIVMHAMRRQRWHAALAWGWFAAALGVSLVFASPWFAPYIAAVALLLMVLPGIAMIRMSRAVA